MQHSSMHFRADTVPGGSNMTEPVRFHALERSGETADNVLAHGHAAATQPRPAPTSLFDLGQLAVEWEEEMGTLWAFINTHDRPNYKERKSVVVGKRVAARLDSGGRL